MHITNSTLLTKEKHTKKRESIDSILIKIAARDPNQFEFIQAVEEVLNDIKDFYYKNNSCATLNRWQLLKHN